MRTALVTGGSSGMGLEYSRQLAAQGYRLVLVSNRQDQLDAAAAELNALTGDAEEAVAELNAQIRTEEAPERGTERQVICRWADLTAENAAEELHGWCVAEGLLPDVLVCNAGMFFFGELSPEKSDTVQAMLNLHIRVNTQLCHSRAA